MAARGQLTVFEELTWLRNRVTELERQAFERSSVLGAAEEGRELFESLLARIPALAWVSDEFGRSVYENSLFREFVASVGPEAAARLIDVTVTDSIESFPSPGGNRQLRISRFPIRMASGKWYMGGMALDIGAPAISILDSLRREERRSQRLFQSGLSGIMECTGDAICDANDRLLEWLGFSRDELADRALNWRIITPSRYRARDDAAVRELFEHGYWQPYEKEFLDRNGEPVPVLVSAVLNDPGERSFTCFVLNIGERKQTEARLMRSQKLESLGIIAGGVAHDFNNLLATIMGNAGLSLDAIPRDHPAFRPLSEVVIASRRASDLTQQVLAYSGRAAFSIRPVDLSAAVREIGSLLDTTISKKIGLEFDLAEDLPFIEADEGQLQQVIMNLVINASDAIGEQSGEIVISTREIRTREHGRSVCFEVRDTGCGMSEETKARIFDPFFTTKTNGRGLGLAAVLGIVRNHRAALLVESEEGKGTTFRVVFPASEVRPSQDQAVSVTEDLSGTETILVADDDEGIRRMTYTALERFGYRVLLAEDGEEAVRVFREHANEISAVVLDWAMPVMNGDEALKRILAIQPSACVLMSSGYAETETLQRVGKPLLAGFVQKPYTMTQLAERLREVIARSKSRVRAGGSAG
ncbi:MAG TPA: ATP-binding protein [Bryobacteraceae bacterium]|nr:ATP-binding protein [Bryobacteraceae bacterium]